MTLRGPDVACAHESFEPVHIQNEAGQRELVGNVCTNPICLKALPPKFTIEAMYEFGSYEPVDYIVKPE